MPGKKKTAKKRATKKKVTAKKATVNVVRSLTYRGSKIEVVAKAVANEVQVDGKAVVTSRDSDTGAYISREAPYIHYGSLEEVAQAVIDAKQEE